MTRELCVYDRPWEADFFVVTTEISVILTENNNLVDQYNIKMCKIVIKHSEMTELYIIAQIHSRVHCHHLLQSMY